MNENPHILVVDDHRDIRDLVGRYLAKYGMRVTTADGGAEMRKVMKSAAIDLVVLDIMMPGEDGLSLTRFVRETSRVPVILLTAMGEETDRIVGIEMGADDYLVKPFNPRELMARIKAVLRRTHELPPGAEPDTGRLTFAGWTFDPARRELTDADGVNVALSSGEFQLLSVFLARPGMVLTRDQLLDLTRGRQAVPFDRAIDNQVSRLRRKIEANPKEPEIIRTVWGGGYVFAAKVDKT
ncbi:MAG: response regulator [Flavobacteriaceae bacterium]